MKYFIYARKSTEEDDRQILSIEAQLVELKEFAAKEKLEIVASFQEAKTAKEPGRTLFGEMLQRIEQGEANGIISWHPDRLARNSVDGGKIIHMIDKGAIKALKFPCFWFEPTPQGLFMLNIAFGQSKYFVDNLRENVKRGLRQKVRNGVYPSKAPIGYLNNLKTRLIDVNPEKADKIKKVFELYTHENYTLHSLANWCQKNGLLNNRNGSVSINGIYKILKNIFYLGLFKYNNEIFEGIHEPIISKKLFDETQKKLKERGKVCEVKKHYFSFLGLMKCPCGCSITAERKKGHNYYRCTKKKGPCGEKHFLREESLIEQIKNYLQKVSLSSHDLEKIMFELEKDESEAMKQAKIAVKNLKDDLIKVESQLEKLLDAYLAGVIVADEYTPRKQKILIDKLELQEKIRDFEQQGQSWLEPAREFVLSLNQAAKIIENQNKEEMTTFLKNTGSNHILQNRQLIFDYKIPYDLVAASGGQTEGNLTFSRWYRHRESDPG